MFILGTRARPSSNMNAIGHLVLMRRNKVKISYLPYNDHIFCPTLMKLCDNNPKDESSVEYKYERNRRYSAHAPK